MDTNRCKYCQEASCGDCQIEKERKSLDISILRDIISGLDEVTKIPLIEKILERKVMDHCD
jgi:NADH:ubiquinone oxidoreductase subunit F (NADH-binding)